VPQDELSRILRELTEALPQPNRQNAREVAYYVSNMWINNFSTYIPELRTQENEHRVRKVLYDIAVGLLSSGLYALLTYLITHGLVQALGGVSRFPRETDPITKALATSVPDADLQLLADHRAALYAAVQDKFLKEIRASALKDSTLTAIAARVASQSKGRLTFNPEDVVLEHLYYASSTPGFAQGVVFPVLPKSPPKPGGARGV